MEYFKELPAIGRDMGQVLMLVGLTSLLPIAVGLIYQEWDAIPWMAISTAALCGTGFILRFFIPKTDFRPRTSLSVAYTALVWLIVGVFGCFPFLYTGAPLLDCAFESMSAWTGTGFSILPNLDEIPKTLLFWRSLMQWIGALGIVAFTLTIASRSGLVTRNLYRSEGRTESFMPSVIATVFQTWKIYLVLTGISFILILLTGVGVWDSINLALCGIATGGMTIHSAGIPYYNNFALELILIPVMIAGAVPFRLYYAAYVKHSVKEILKDKMLHTIIAIFIFVSAVIIIELKAAGFSLLNAVRQGLFMAGTAVSSTGFQNTDFSGWPIAIIIFISVFLLIGGPQGSTAGGLKIDRIIVMFNTFVWWFKKTMLSSKAVLRMKHNDNTLKSETSESLIAGSFLMVMLSSLMVTAIIIILLHDPYFASNVPATILNVLSCVGNNGAGTSLITSVMPDYSKILFFIVMWIAKLEIIPIMILIWGLFRGFGWENVTKSFKFTNKRK